MILLSSSNFSVKGSLLKFLAIFYIFLFYDWPFLHVRNININVKKICMFALRLKIQNVCCEVVVSGHSIKWVESARYLGVYLVNSTNFKC